jgi:hypothetical protein
MIWFRYRGTFLAATRGAVCGCGTPKGLHLSAQGCCTRLPWGSCPANAQSVVDDNPEGVPATVPVQPRSGCSSFESLGATPLALGRPQYLSQGSRVPQPWAVRCNPVGIGPAYLRGIDFSAACRSRKKKADEPHQRPVRYDRATLSKAASRQTNRSRWRPVSKR